MHPGGLKLTEQLAVLADVNEKSTVLDVASGRGVSAIFLAKRFCCEVVGVDLSKSMIQTAAASAKSEMVSDRVVFKVSDAEKLPFKNEIFDAIISECALCLFPTKKRSLLEMHRVLKDGGKIAISDVTLDQTCGEIRNKLLFFSCVGGAESLVSLQSLLEDVGFVEVTAIDTSQAIVDLYKSLKRQSFLLKLLLKIVGSLHRCVDLENVNEFGLIAEQLILEKKLGYGVLVGRKSIS